MIGRVVAVSRTIGAGGETIAHLVSRELGLRYVDEEIITAAAKKAGVNPHLVADAEKRQGLLLRFIDGLGERGVTADHGFMFTGAPEGERSEDFRELIRDALRETAERGDVVIVAHAASMALAGRENLLRVLITASPEMRVWRVADFSKVHLAEAEQIVKRSDAARADYIRRFYDVDRELPTHYDLVINTDEVSPDQAAKAVLALVPSDDERGRPAPPAYT
jgi:cytidylate kinase